MGHPGRPHSSRAREDVVARDRREERLASNSATSGSTGGGEASGEEIESAWVLSDGTAVDEAGGRMTVAAVTRLKLVFSLPGVVKLRPPLKDERASILPAGHAAVHEAIFRQGVTFPLLPNLQILVCEFGLAFGQICPNMWRLLMALNSLWLLSGSEGPTVAEVLHFYELVYVKRHGCSGQVNLSRRQGASKLIENLKDSMSPWRVTLCVTIAGWEYQAGWNEGESTFKIKSEFQPIRDSPPGNKASCDAFAKAMDRAEINNFLEDMYVAGLAAEKTVVDPQTLVLSQSEVLVVLPMPHHSHLSPDGTPAAPEKARERMPANRRGPQRDRVVARGEVTAAVLEPQVASRPVAAGATRVVLQRKRRQNDPEEEDDATKAETIGARQQKKAKQAPPKVLVAAAREVQTSDLDSFAAYTEFLTDPEREFLFHLCERRVSDCY
ncbi:uncharacterized protein LOC133716123 [Rosa rugosa]|uniref:uncharacterized protein LOC133716123 n=1 Tax=Rosa rugosa TaxID=74645 RepID=UPI002B40E966|nr:uncharacterized protein LOC133716123 [Rosa rugosa]